MRKNCLILILFGAMLGCTPVPGPIKAWKGATAQALEQHWGPPHGQTLAGERRSLSYTASFEQLPSGLPEAILSTLPDGRRVFAYPARQTKAQQDIIRCAIVYTLENNIVTGVTSDGLGCRYVTAAPDNQLPFTKSR